MIGNDVERLLGQWIRFSGTEQSGNALAFCPFHKGGQEHTPSMYVYVGKETSTKSPGVAYCHTCAQGWQLIGLLRKFGASASIIDLIRAELGKDKPKDIDKARTLDLSNPILPESIMVAFDYAPVALLKSGFDRDILRDNDVGFDRIARRITFGLRDHKGNLIGVSGRAMLDTDIPRYKIYKSEFYGFISGYSLDKSRMVWGLDKLYPSRMYGKTSGPLVICEGFKAALWVKQAGYDAVCVLGTNLSYEQQVLITRVAPEVILFLDNDIPGIKATWKATTVLAKSVVVRVANYGTSQPLSPDDLPPEDVTRAIEMAVPVSQWRQKQHESYSQLPSTSDASSRS